MGLKQGEFTDTNISAVNKTITVLKALNKGKPIKLGEYYFKIGETLNGGFSLLIQFDISNSEGEKWIEYLGFQGSFANFTEICNNLTDKELLLISAENEINNN